MQSGIIGSEQSRILLVEDESSLRETYGDLLEYAGFLVCKAEGYDQAVALIDSSIDLALLDIRLEGKSGLEVLAYIQEKHPDCPTIMISGYADKEDIIQALNLGAAEFLEKPIAPDALLRSIKHWLDFSALKQENKGLQNFKALFQRLQDSEEKTRMSNERLNFLLASTAAVIYESDTSEDFATTYISDNVKRLCGYGPEDFTSEPGFRLGRIHPDDLENVKSELERVLETGANRIEYRFRHKDGHYCWLADEVRLERNMDGQIEFMGFLADITEHQHDVETIREMAYTDQLTGLPNRSLYYDRLKQALAHAQRSKSCMAVLFMDLDYFKPINDELGHEWGDHALIEVGRRLRECTRKVDTVARVGGDEFSIILDGASTEESVRLVAGKIIDRIREPMMLKGSEYVLGISIGICLTAEESSDREVIMRLADDAMYQAKEMGRNRYCIYRSSGENISDELNEELDVEKALRHAISNDELEIYYQPKVELTNGIITGTHALLRWNRGESEVVMPDQFLPIAIKTGLIVPIGEWVLRRACAQNRAWQDAGLSIVPVSVNVTAEQLRHADFSKLVAGILDEYGLAAAMLQLEIGETELMQHGDAIMRSLNELNNMGVKLTIGNFGAGYFSLQLLKAMPVHALKMNRSLVKQIGQGGGQVANAIIAMGHILNHQVVAEGVETTDQLEFLRQHGPDGMLGYLSGPPVPADELAQQLKNGKSMLAT